LHIETSSAYDGVEAVGQSGLLKNEIDLRTSGHAYDTEGEFAGHLTNEIVDILKQWNAVGHQIAPFLSFVLRDLENLIRLGRAPDSRVRGFNKCLVVHAETFVILLVGQCDVLRREQFLIRFHLDRFVVYDDAVEV